MADIDTLQTEARKHRMDAEGNEKLAQSLYASAETHEASGDTARAKLDRDAAIRAEGDARRMIDLATTYEVDAMRRRSKAKDIESKIEALKKGHQKEIERLEQELHDVLHRF